MKDKKFRKALDAYVEDHGFEETKLFDNHSYDGAIIGITAGGKLVYLFSKMVEDFMKDEECSESEAIEWLEYNTLRALPYLGEDAPIIIMDSKEDIEEQYGD